MSTSQIQRGVDVLKSILSEVMADANLPRVFAYHLKTGDHGLRLVFLNRPLTSDEASMHIANAEADFRARTGQHYNWGDENPFAPRSLDLVDVNRALVESPEIAGQIRETIEQEVLHNRFVAQELYALAATALEQIAVGNAEALKTTLLSLCNCFDAVGCCRFG